MSKPAKTKKSAAPSPKVAQKSKPRKHAPAKPAAAPAAKKSAAKIPRFVPSIKERGHAIMFRVSPDEMALIVDDATKHKDRSLSAAMRRRLGFS